MHVDPNGTVYIGCLIGTATGRIWELDPTTRTLRRVVAGLPASTPLQIVQGDGSALLGGELVVADQNTEITQQCCDGRVLRVNRSSGAATVAVGSLTSATDDPAGIAIGRGAYTAAAYVMNQQGSSTDVPRLFAVSPSGQISIFAQNPSHWPGTRNPSRIAIDPHGLFTGHLFVSDAMSDSGGSGVLWRVSPAGVISPFLASADITAVSGLAFAPPCFFGTDMYIMCGDRTGQPPRLWRVRPDATLDLVASAFPAIGGGSAGIAFSPDGTAMYVGLGDQVWVVRPRPSVSPASGTICPGGSASFAVSAAGDGQYSYEWQVETGSGVWVTLDADPISLPCGGTASASSPHDATTSITITPCVGLADYRVRCTVTAACGSVTSEVAVVTTACPCLACPADFNQDGGIDGADVDAFFIRWEAGHCDADVNQDGGVDGADVDTFFAAWEAGGCG
jgi:hypothetical protein